LTNFNITPVLQFVAYSVLNTPINVAWQSWLESKFPSTKVVVKHASEKPRSVHAEETLDKTNTAIKFILDQTVGAAFNVPLYFAILGALKGQSADYIINAIKAVCIMILSERSSKLTTWCRTAGISTRLV
jgi:hypothetical protein